MQPIGTTYENLRKIVRARRDANGLTPLEKIGDLDALLGPTKT
jgi:hypothetical protein